MDLYLLGSLVATTTILTVNIRLSKDRVITTKNILAVTAFLVQISALFIVVLLSTTQYVVPAVYIVPPATLVTALIFRRISTYNIFVASITMINRLRRAGIALRYLQQANSSTELKKIQLDQERQMIIEALEKEGSKKGAAKILGMAYSTFIDQTKKHGL